MQIEYDQSVLFPVICRAVKHSMHKNSEKPQMLHLLCLTESIKVSAQCPSDNPVYYLNSSRSLAGILTRRKVARPYQSELHGTFVMGHKRNNKNKNKDVLDSC